MGGLSAWLRDLASLGRRRIATQEQLRAFLQGEAAFVAQKCVDDYCRAKVGLTHYALSEEAAYQDALRASRWESYAAVLADLCLVVARHLHPSGGADRAMLDRGLRRIYAEVLENTPIPQGRPESWDTLAAGLAERLDWVGREPRPDIPAIAAVSGHRMFETLPIHSRYRELDEEVVVNSVQFQTVAFHERMARRVDPAALAADLTREAGTGSH